MNEAQKDPAPVVTSTKPSWWGSSLYDEPWWQTVLWIVGPLLIGGVAVFLAMR